MISRKTVFILGAGAHVPYGLMDGATLIAAILRSFTDSTQSKPFFDHLYSCCMSTALKDAIQQFPIALDLGGHTSIDSFLATHGKRPGFTDIGKQAVAWQLLPREFLHRWSRRPQQGDWMSFLFETMLHGCINSVDEFTANNSVDFVTFNYDRTLEHFLCTRLAHTYTLSPADAWKKAQKFKIAHVYGSLGEFRPRVISTTPSTDTRATLAGTSVSAAANSIRLMYDDRTDHSGIKDAIDLISSAPYVCFLGFGFDPDNIAALKLNECCSGKAAAFATRYKTKAGDWNRVVQNMAPAILNPATAYFDNNAIEWDSLEFLHQTGALG